MTEVLGGAPALHNPYMEVDPLHFSDLGIDLKLMGFAPGVDPSVPTYRWDPEYTLGGLDSAAAYYKNFGIAVLGENCKIDADLKIGDIPEKFGEPAIEQCLRNREKMLGRRETRADSSLRYITVIPPQTVAEYVPAITGLAARLGPVFEAFGGPGATLTPSIYDMPLANAMVVPTNPKRSRSNDGMQSHGLHSDTDSITVLSPFINLGTGGEFCLVDGVQEACETAGVDPNESLQEIIRRVDPNDIRFLLHRAMPGLAIVADTTNLHCVTPKRPQDIQATLSSGEPWHDLGDGHMLARLVPNIPGDPIDRLALIEQARWVALVAYNMGFGKMTREALQRAHEAGGTTPDDIDKVNQIMSGVDHSVLLYGPKNITSMAPFERVSQSIEERHAA